MKSGSIPQYLKYLFTPENSAMESNVAPGGRIKYYGPDVAGISKAVFWLIVSMILSFLLSCLH